MLQLFKLIPYEQRRNVTRRKHWLSQGKWKVFQYNRQRITHVKGMLFHELPPIIRVKYEWEEPSECYILWYLAKGMSNLDKTVVAFPTHYCDKPRKLIWFASETTVIRRAAIKAEFFDMVATKYGDVSWRLHRKNRFLCAFTKTHSGGIRNGLLAVIKPYDIPYELFHPDTESP